MKTFFSYVGFLLLCSSPLLEARPRSPAPEVLTCITLTDRNGLSETITTKERLKTLSQIDFLSPQPYQKVMCLYGKGTHHGYIASYHPNGQIKQYVEIANHRALGRYCEWYPNGVQKIEATVIGGIADLNANAEKSWLFDGENYAWNEEGILVAAIPYSKGELQGEALHYHDNGTIWKRTPYVKGALEGMQSLYTSEGTLFQTNEFHQNEREGTSYRYWPDGSLTYQETYQHGLLQEANYFDLEGKEIASIHKGKGIRALFGKDRIIAFEEWREGTSSGQVRLLDEQGALSHSYYVKKGVKQGEEIEYFPGTTQPKLLLTWYGGTLHGPMKTWYPDGTLESQREMSANKKNGILTAWYQNGTLMLVEEYDNDKLIKGEYYRMGEKQAISKVEKGKGVATLFSPQGTPLQKVSYQEGLPTTSP